LADDLHRRFGASIRQACGVLSLSRSVYHYRSRAADQAPLVGRIKELAATRLRYGYKRIHVLLKREGWQVNHKRVYRLYRREGLSLFERRPKRHRSAAHRPKAVLSQVINECWSMDFVADQLFDGRRLRALTLVDTYTRECLAIEVAAGLRGEDVVRVIDAVTILRDAPQRVRVDNGPEFVSRALDQWAYANSVELVFSRPGKPTDNAYIESFNGRLREECLNTHWFLSLEDARSRIEAWRCDYNEARPHSALDWATPAEFARKCRLVPVPTGTREPEISSINRS
jgi:putative transposase